jgi:hypothetical protein
MEVGRGKVRGGATEKKSSLVGKKKKFAENKWRCAQKMCRCGGEENMLLAGYNCWRAGKVSG